MAAAAPQRFGFVQLEFAGALGLVDGRYLAREELEAEPRILVVQSLAVAHKPRRRPGRRPGREADPVDSLPLSRVTVVFSDRPFKTEKPAQRWMRENADDAEARTQVLGEAAGLLNRALHALAVSNQDAYVPQLSPAQAIAARIGHGLGPELAEGNFTQALALPTIERSRRRGQDQVAPQERVAAILGRRENAEVCETFVLRARADFSASRDREGILSLFVAVESLVIDLDDALNDPAHEADLSLLNSQREDLNRLAGAARHGRLDRGEVERGVDLLALCERILRRRRLLRG